MLLKIFAAIGAGGSVLHTLIAGQTGNALETTGILLLRFLEYFFGAHIAYALVMLLSTELFIRKSKPQEKPSKFWLWHLHAVADLLCFYARADVSITGYALSYGSKPPLACRSRRHGTQDAQGGAYLHIKAGQPEDTHHRQGYAQVRLPAA